MANVLRPPGVVRHLADLFALALYQRVQPLLFSSSSDFKSYTDNTTFWSDAHAKRHRQLMPVYLTRFHLMEWLPASPGRYFTEEARSSRANAELHLDPRLNEYRLEGKSDMIRGGMGSFRLAAQHFDGRSHYFLGATSTGISHEGIPVVLNERDYQQVMPLISRAGGCLVDLEGTLQILQMSPPAANIPFSSFYYPGASRYCLVVKHVYIREPSPEEGLFATVAIAFSLEKAFSPTKGWAYTSFHPGWGQNLEDAVAWLQNYAERHSADRSGQPIILADFDEHYQHFDTTVQFPLSQMRQGMFDASFATTYQRLYAPFSQRLRPALRERVTPSAPKPVRTLLCFAEEDELMAETLKASLQGLQRRKSIDIHLIRDIPVGSEIQAAIEQEFEQAQLILLLLSADFLADNHCYEEFALRALHLHEQGKVVALRISVRPAMYEGLPLEHLKLLPENGIPILDTRWQGVDYACYDIARTLQDMIEALA
jgi:hypothetical protein